MPSDDPDDVVRTAPGWRVGTEWDDALREWAHRRGWPLYVAYEMVLEEWLDDHRHADVAEELADWLDDAPLTLGRSEAKKKISRGDETRKIGTPIREELLDEFRATDDTGRYGSTFDRAIREFLTRPSEERMADAVSALREHYQDDTEPESEEEAEESAPEKPDEPELPEGVTPGSVEGKTLRMAHRLPTTFMKGDLRGVIAELGGTSDYYFDRYEERVMEEKGVIEHPVKDGVYIPEEWHERTIEAICDHVSLPCPDRDIHLAIIEETSFERDSLVEEAMRVYTPMVREQLEAAGSSDSDPDGEGDTHGDVRAELDAVDIQEAADVGRHFGDD